MSSIIIEYFYISPEIAMIWFVDMLACLLPIGTLYTLVIYTGSFFKPSLISITSTLELLSAPNMSYLL